jgi:hypothetical protein
MTEGCRNLQAESSKFGGKAEIGKAEFKSRFQCLLFNAKPLRGIGQLRA